MNFHFEPDFYQAMEFFRANVCCPKDKAHKGNKAVTLETFIQMLFYKRDFSEAENRVWAINISANKHCKQVIVTNLDL